MPTTEIPWLNEEFIPSVDPRGPQGRMELASRR
jgi:hypothetical protein